MNMDKKILVVIMLVGISMVVEDILKILGIVEITEHHARLFNILFSMLILLGFSVLIKHKYWIFASVFTGLNEAAQIVSAFLSKSSLNINISIHVAILIGAVCESIAVFYFYKLIKVEDFSFKKYLRFQS